MLNIFRKNTKLILLILLILLIPPFIFFGIDFTHRSKKNPIVGIVDGKKIKLFDFISNLRLNEKMLKLFSSRKLPFNTLENITWKRMVLLLEAHKNHIVVSNRELVEWLEQRIGKENLSVSNYNQLLKNLNMTNNEFESYIKDSIAIEKIKNEIESSIQIPDTQLKNIYRKKNEKLNIQYYEVLNDSFEDKVILNEDQLKEFFNKNKENYQINTTRKAKYIHFNQDDFISNDFNPSQEELMNFYQKNKEKYSDKDPSSKFEDVQDLVSDDFKKFNSKKLMNQQVEEIFLYLSQNQDFEPYLKKKNITLGETDYISQYQFDLPGISNPYKFSQTLFKTSLKTVSEPLNVSDGIYLIYPVDQKEPHIPEFQDVVNQVTQDFTKQEKENLCLIEAQKIQKELTKNPEHLLFQEFKSVSGMTRNDAITEISPYFKLNETIFNLPESSLTDPIQSPKGYLIIQVLNKESADLSKYEEEKSSLLENELKMKKQLVIQDWIETLMRQNSIQNVENLIKNIN